MKLLGIAVLLAGLTTAQGALIFGDNFDSSLSATTLNATVPGWSSLNGTVDYIKSGGFGITCLGNTGGCIDLDGSTGNAADFTSSTTFNLMSGSTYTLTYWLSGNQRGSSDTVLASFGGVTNTHSFLSSTPFTQYSISFTAGANSSSAVVFSNQGGDNLGAILDSVSLDESSRSAVPEPSTYAMLASGLAAMYLKLRKR